MKSKSPDWLHVIRHQVVFFILGAISINLYADDVSRYEKKKYKIISGAGNSVCSRVASFFNSKINQGDPDLYSGGYFDAFSWKQTKLVISSEGREPAVIQSAEYAWVNIYNDNNPILIARYKSGGGPFVAEAREYVSVMPSFVANIVSSEGNVAKKDLMSNSSWIGPRRLVFYSLKHLASIENPEVTEPFNVDGTTYISIRELPRYDLNNGFLYNQYKYNLIVKYRARDIARLNQMIDGEGRGSMMQAKVRQDLFLDVVCVFSK